MADRMNQRNLRRSGGESEHPVEAAYNPKTYEERVAETLERHSRKSTADEISDDLSRVLDGLDDVKKAVQGDDEAAERVANGDYVADDGTDDDGDMVEKAGKAVRKADVPDDFPDLPNEDYSGVVDDANDTGVSKSEDAVVDGNKRLVGGGD